MGEEPRAERPHATGGAGVPARRARELRTASSALPCLRGRGWGGEEAGWPALPPGRKVSACPVTAVQAEPLHRAAARLSQGPAGGAAMAADAPGTLPVQLVEQPRWVGRWPRPRSGWPRPQPGRGSPPPFLQERAARWTGEVGGQAGRSDSVTPA